MGVFPWKAVYCVRMADLIFCPSLPMENEASINAGELCVWLSALGGWHGRMMPLEKSASYIAATA